MSNYDAWQKINKQNVYQNNAVQPTIYSLPFGYNLPNNNNFIFLAPIFPTNGSTLSTKITSSSGGLPQFHIPQNEKSITNPNFSENTNSKSNNCTDSEKAIPESKTSLQQNIDNDTNQEITIIKQQKIEDETLKRLQEANEIDDEPYNLDHLVQGVPRISKSLSSVPKRVKLICSDVIRWKKVQINTKQEDGDQSEFESSQKPQRKKRKRVLKKEGIKTRANKRVKLKYDSEDEDIENQEIDNEISFGCEDRLLAGTVELDEYNNSQNGLTGAEEDGVYQSDLNRAEISLDDKNGIVKDQSSWSILDEIEKSHSSKDFHELSVENDDSKAFTTIKDIAERLTKHDNIDWEQCSEYVDQFSIDGAKYNDPYDGQDEEAAYEESKIENSGLEANTDVSKRSKKVTKKKVLRKKSVKKGTDTTIDEQKLELSSVPSTPMWPLPPLGDERSQIFSEFTKKGKRRKRLPRRDLRQYLPKVNPILKKNGDPPKEPPKKLDDYIVVRSAKAPRKAYTKYNTLDNPEFGNRFNVSMQSTTSQDDDDEGTPDEDEELECSTEQETPSKQEQNNDRNEMGNDNETYDGESQEDIESESQEDLEKTPIKRPKTTEGNNNDTKKMPAEQYAAMHADRNTYGCIFCNYMAPKKEWLIHLKRKHRDKNLVFCTYVKFCNMPFEFIKDLDTHIKEIHSKHSQTGPRFRDVKSYVEFEGEENDEEKDLKPKKKLERTAYKCRFCDFRGIKRQWILHLKTKHADKNLVFCEFSRACSLPFDNQELLDDHVKTFHLTNTCDICGQEFKFRNVLREHKKIHNPEVSLSSRKFIEFSLFSL